LTVATHASALKAHRQNVIRREQNRALRSQLRGALKLIRTAIDKDDLDTARARLSDTVSLIDRMAAKRIIHDNAAARYKSRLQVSLTRKSAPR
jgi:small subunit ribosomal protein S20